MGMVFQQFNLFPHMTILENLTLAPMKLSGKEKQGFEAEGNFLNVGLQDRAAAYRISFPAGRSSVLR